VRAFGEGRGSVFKKLVDEMGSYWKLLPSSPNESFLLLYQVPVSEAQIPCSPAIKIQVSWTKAPSQPLQLELLTIKQKD